MPRTYQKKKRAEQQDETRTRIVEATITLHQQIGGPATTISAIADLAGVERATVYRHFPDERALLQACTGHYIMQNPPPAPDAWLQIDDAKERFRVALEEIYDYHRRTEVMSSRAAIDIPQMPTLREVLGPFFAYWEQVKRVLSEPWCRDGQEKPLVAAAIGHAVAFQTWQSLVRMQGLEDGEAVRVMVRMVHCVAKLD
jgi:AcrR family transcriptional regulator